ncbi:fatty acid-binding protein [Yarrowia lipolytica]|uniref:Fatty acid-binding protein n=2 Tax=Yarrowia lipolytica TaxID=4952 RepID=SCP2_YARLI|nr:YALI0E01298p [Yarrowia lipolytica CLIB122]P80547.4 RecName: Full=Fatty acid-binding protein; AltName: Full=Sterol carrier protein 2; AltName: Full=YLSCP2 [Yarrowia lipolytica CLIB122]4JGX_A Chain A, Fatty acid-binding protein [Yarrowia lipolytica CLIB122]4JGX_B Chain B, Fatty acid-binding protein [Yarrowia lipolytica CLIB122]6OVP_A Chain A, Fatty acid-binding protein [Yarrowia lipolytica]6OVP_B Chain B, Fatty acid-binding protein [Yarrowia lipolytica]KAB8282857.1 fatty acid-binding protein|eukprot:XP_503410.1 YALI0E01298p [Yarrowia lipolytica CLIB122]
MSLKVDGFTSSIIFDVIRDGLNDPSQAKQKAESIKKANAIIVFNLKNKAGKTESWYLDLKNDGDVGKGNKSPKGDADIQLTLSDDHFQQLVEGKANAQRLFMTGKLKVKGNVMKAAAIEGILKNAQNNL